MKAQILSFHCVLKNKLGQVLSTSFNQDVINQHEAGTDSIRLSGLVSALQNVTPGELRKFSVPASQAYGPYDPKLVLTIRRGDLAKGRELEIGSEIDLRSDRDGQMQAFRVTLIKGDLLTLDGNHPLAGHDLTFEIEVVAARDARDDDFEEPFLAATNTYLH